MRGRLDARRTLKSLVADLRKELREGEFKIIDINGLQIKRHFCFVRAQGQEEAPAANFIRFVQGYLKSRKAAGDIIGKMMV